MAVTYDDNRQKWKVDFRDQNNKRRRKWFKLKRDADKYHRDKLDEVGKGTYMAEREIPTFKEVAAAFLEAKAQEVRDTTLEQYRQHIECHINPILGETRLDLLLYDELEKYTKAKIKEGRISYATIRKTLTTLGAVLAYSSVKYRVYDYRAQDIKQARKLVSKKAESNNGERQDKKEISYLDQAQAKKLIQAADAKSHKHGMLFYLAIYTGLRQGELLGLEWQDIDLDKGVLHVRRTFNHGKVRDTKSDSSTRDIDLSKDAVQRLREWKIACPITDRQLVFPSDVGNHIEARNLYNRVYKPLLKKAGLPEELTFHALRHTFAMHMIGLMKKKEYMDPKYIQNQMGHSSIMMTFDVYGKHMREPDQTTANDLVEHIQGN